MSQALVREHCGISYTDLAQWFNELRDFILDENHPQILDDATSIYNCDETGFPLSPKAQQSHRSQVWQTYIPGWNIIKENTNNDANMLLS